MVKNSIHSITIGSFDGIHIAHKELISLAEHIVTIEHRRGTLTPGWKRSLYTDKAISFYLLEKIKDWSAKEFIDRLKIDFPNLKKIVVGYDFRFGKDKIGTPKLIESLFSGEVVVIDEITVNGISVHSRTIREYLKNGDLDMTRRMLGRDYIIDGEIIKGQGLGSKEFVPTINLKVEDYTLPKAGVYATRTKLDSKWYKSVTFLGHRNTTDSSFAIETHILDCECPDIDSKVAIEFKKFLRENRKFDSFAKLKEAISADIQESRKY